LSDNPITLEAITYGYTMGLSFLAVAFIFVSYNAIMTSHKFLYVFSRISPKIALLTMIAVRFVPLFIRRLTYIQLVQKTKGIHTETGSLKKRAGHGMKLLSVLLICSLEEALQTADSMQARGFGTMKRSTYIRYRMMRRDWGIVFALVLLFFISIAAASNGAGILVIYPKLGPLLIDGQDWLVYASFLVYISIPLLLEGREWVWWHIQK
jgi:energy-coupling factor transport system permease protein